MTRAKTLDPEGAIMKAIFGNMNQTTRDDGSKVVDGKWPSPENYFRGLSKAVLGFDYSDPFGQDPLGGKSYVTDLCAHGGIEGTDPQNGCMSCAECQLGGGTGDGDSKSVGEKGKYVNNCNAEEPAEMKNR